MREMGSWIAVCMKRMASIHSSLSLPAAGTMLKPEGMNNPLNTRYATLTLSSTGYKGH